jgi:hypothetical protein
MNEATLRSWGATENPVAKRRAMWVLVGVGALSAGVLGALYAGIAAAGGSSWIVVAGIGIGIFGAIRFPYNNGWRALRSVKARRISAAQHPRFANLVAGLSADIGISAPELWVNDSEEPNAFIGRGRAGRVVISDGALRSLNRTELEALVANCLVRLESRGWLEAGVASGSPFARLVGRVVDSSVDLKTVAVTRYPPALVSALEKSVPATGRFAPFYFSAIGPSHQPVDQRIAALNDL